MLGTFRVKMVSELLQTGNGGTGVAVAAVQGKQLGWWSRVW